LDIKISQFFLARTSSLVNGNQKKQSKTFVEIFIKNRFKGLILKCFTIDAEKLVQVFIFIKISFKPDFSTGFNKIQIES